jgi:hypothetical protein
MSGWSVIFNLYNKFKSDNLNIKGTVITDIIINLLHRITNYSHESRSYYSRKRVSQQHEP